MTGPGQISAWGESLWVLYVRRFPHPVEPAMLHSLPVGPVEPGFVVG